MITVTRYHDFSYGHRVVGHEGKCNLLHGHNARVRFTCASDQLDDVGRVIDFSVIKTTLCAWLEDNWDHKFLVWLQDPAFGMYTVDTNPSSPLAHVLRKSLVFVPFNPTAENMANYLLTEIGPHVLPSNIRLVAVQLDETRKCSSHASL